MLSLYFVRALLLSLVHAAAATEESVDRTARRLRWMLLRFRSTTSLTTTTLTTTTSRVVLGFVPPRLRRGALGILNFYAQVFIILAALCYRIGRVVLPRKLRQKASSVALTPPSNSPSPSTTTKAATTTQRGSNPAHPATSAAVILAEAEEEDLPLSRVADVVEWCSQSGLERLFVYDPAGHVKRGASELRDELAKRSIGRRRRREWTERGGGAGRRKSTIQRGWSGPVIGVDDGGNASDDSGASLPSSSSSSSSSPPPPRDLHIHLLSGEDAEEPLLAAAAAVEAIREKSGGDGDGSSRSSEAERRENSNGGGGGAAAASPPPSSSGRDALDAALDAAAAATAAATGAASSFSSNNSESKRSCWTSKPDVALCYGDHLTLAGFPPWPLAQSEVYSMGPLRLASKEGVEEAAARFLSTSQRFGR